MAKIKKTFRFTPEAANKIESSLDQTEFVENAVLQYNNSQKTIPKPNISEIKNMRIEV